MQYPELSTTPAGPSPSTPSALVDNDPFPTMFHDPDSEVTFTDGNIAWQWGNGTVTPRLTGTLHVVNGDDARFRVRVDSYDANNNKVGTAYDKDNGHPIHTDDPKDIAVDMNGAAGPNVRRAVVALEKQGTSAKWKTKDESDVLELDTFDDSVTIRGSGIDVGGADFANGAPTGPATVSWRFGDDGTLTATYTGYLHLTNFHQGSGRVVIRAINSLTGRASATAEGDTHTAEDNGHHAYQDTLAVVSDVAELEVAMQSWVTDPETGQGSWTDVDSQTVNVAA